MTEMDCKSRMRLKTYWIVLAIVMTGVAAQPLYAQGLSAGAMGFRAGISDHRDDEDYQQYEGFAIWALPWYWQLSTDWTMGTYLEMNAGVLTGGGESAFVGSIGPGIHFTGFGEHVVISMGINPTIISQHSFGDDNFGGPLQFTSHIGLNLNFFRHFTMGYRLQHMSNAGIYSSNPGVNIHMIEAGYRF